MESVGLVVVSYNHADFMPACLQSIEQQSVMPNRVVLVDDQSSDASAEIASKWAESRSEDISVETIVTPRQGPSAAFNAGVAATDTDLVAIIAADDLLMTTRLERSAQLVSEFDVELVLGRPAIIDENGDPQPDSFAPEFFPSSDAVSGTVFQNLLRHGNYLCAGTAMFRRPAFEELGGFHPGLIQLQDYHLWVRWAQRTLHITDERLISYRKTHHSLSSEQNNARMMAELQWVRRHCLDGASQEQLAEIVLSGQDPDSSVPTDPAIRKALAFLNLTHSEFRRLGYERLLDILSEPEGIARLRAAGLEMQDVFGLMPGSGEASAADTPGELLGFESVRTAVRRLGDRVVSALGRPMR